MPKWEDLGAFLDDDEFSVPAVVPGQATLVSVIFDSQFVNAEAGEYELDTSQPRINGRAVDLEHIANGDPVLVDGVEYLALGSAEPDGTGWCVVRLVKQGQGNARF